MVKNRPRQQKLVAHQVISSLATANWTVMVKKVLLQRLVRHRVFFWIFQAKFEEFGLKYSEKYSMSYTFFSSTKSEQQPETCAFDDHQVRDGIWYWHPVELLPPSFPIQIFQIILERWSKCCRSTMQRRKPNKNLNLHRRNEKQIQPPMKNENTMKNRYKFLPCNVDRKVREWSRGKTEKKRKRKKRSQRKRNQNLHQSRWTRNYWR